MIKIEIPVQMYFQPPPKIPADAKINPQSVIEIIGTETRRYFPKGIFKEPSIVVENIKGTPGVSRRITAHSKRFLVGKFGS